MEDNDDIATIAEALLMATGLIEAPTRTHIRASKLLWGEMRKEALAALDRETPGRLYVCPPRPKYHDALGDAPDYQAYEAVIAPVLGQDVADAYQALHRAARDVMAGLHPVTTIETILGHLVLPNDTISDGRWFIEVDVIEGSRLVRDMAAGALLKEEVDVFNAIYPRAHEYLRSVVNDDLARRRGNTKSYQPQWWITDSLRMLLGLPLGVALKINSPALPEPAPKKSGSAKLDTEGLQTASQKA